MNLVVQSAFQFALTDRLSLNDKDLVQVITSIDGSHTARSLRMVVAKERAYPLNETVLSQLFTSSKESSSDIYASVEVRSWSPSLRIAEDVRTKLNFLILKETRKLHLTSSEIVSKPYKSQMALTEYQKSTPEIPTKTRKWMQIEKGHQINK